MDLIDRIINKDNFVTWWGLVIFLLLGAGALLTFEALFKEIVFTPITRLIIYGLALLVLFCIWWSVRQKLPQRPPDLPNAVSIVLAIDTEDEKARSRLETDFISEFRNQVEVSQVADMVFIQPTEKYQAARIIKSIESLREESRLYGSSIHNTKTHRDWSDIHKEVRGDFYLYGKLYSREKGKYVLDFRGHVDEAFSPQLKDELAGYYNAFGVEKKLIDEGQEIKGFAVEAKYYYIIAKYVIAFVALYQGGINFSHRLHRDLERDFENTEDFPGKDHLVKQLRARLSLEHFIFARQKFHTGYPDEGEAELRLAEEYDPNNGSVYMFKAVIEFARRRNVDTAMRYVHKARDLASPDDGSWRYSEAFLLMFKQKYREAWKVYEYILQNPYPHEEYTVQQVIDFNEGMLVNYPKFYESHFILGLVKGCKMGDLRTGLDHMRTFLDGVGKSPRYQVLRIEAAKLRDSFQDDLQLETTVNRLLVENS